MSREQSIELSRRFLATLRKSTSLNEPVSFAQVRVGPFREPVYSVTWPGPVNVETSPEGVVVGYMDLQLARKPEERNRLTNAVEALNIAMDIADGLEILLNEARVTEIKRVALPN